MNPGIKKMSALLLSAALLLASLAACGSASSAAQSTAASAYPEMAAPAAAPAYDGDYAETTPAMDNVTVAGEEMAAADYTGIIMEAPAETGGGLGGAGLVVQQSSKDRRIVLTVDLGLQTTSFDSGIKDVVALTEKVGGYIQDSYVSGSGIGERYVSRSANYTARVPTDRLNEYLEAISGAFNVIHQQQSSTDISMNYNDTDARLKSLRVQEERLLAMLEQSGELDDLLRIEREYADVLYEIEQLTSSLARMDDSVDLSTVTMQLYEVVEYEQLENEPATFGERVGATFGDSWENFKSFCEGVLLFLIALVPFLPVLAVIALIVILVIRRIKKREALDREAAASYVPVFTMPQQPKADQEPPKPDDDHDKD